MLNFKNGKRKHNCFLFFFSKASKREPLYAEKGCVLAKNI